MSVDEAFLVFCLYPLGARVVGEPNVWGAQQTCNRHFLIGRTLLACSVPGMRELVVHELSAATRKSLSTHTRIARMNGVLTSAAHNSTQNNESARKRTLAQALRFVAHINGASLLFCSSKEKKLKDIFRLTLNTVRSRTNRGAAGTYDRNKTKQRQHALHVSSTRGNLSAR